MESLKSLKVKEIINQEALLESTQKEIIGNRADALKDNEFINFLGGIFIFTNLISKRGFNEVMEVVRNV